MNKDLLRKYFKEIKEKTNGDNTSNSEIIDYRNGTCLTTEMLEEEFEKYQKLAQEIEEYIEKNDLDDVINEDEVKKHFKKIDEDLFEYNQAILKDFDEYMAIKINKRNEYIRKAKMIFSKNGNGFDTIKINIPVGWAKELGFSKEDREGIIILENNKIIIKKDF